MAMLAGLLALALPTHAESKIGLLIGSQHFSTHSRDGSRYNNANVGMYYRSGWWSVGTYRNSHHRQSLFVGGAAALNDTFAITGTLASNYPGVSYPAGILPIVGLSATFGPARLTATMRTIILSVEF